MERESSRGETLSETSADASSFSRSPSSIKRGSGTSASIKTTSGGLGRRRGSLERHVRGISGLKIKYSYLLEFTRVSRSTSDLAHLLRQGQALSSLSSECL